MLRLIAQETDSSDPVTPIRWCLTPDLISELKKRDFTHPHILLSVHNGTKETFRTCVPLEQAMEYVEFNTAGQNTINAVILGTKNPKELRYKIELHGGERMRLYDWNGDFDPENTLDFWNLGARILDNSVGSLGVNVEANFFAHEPAEWEKRWVNFWFETEARDQCQFRRRRMVAYSIQPGMVVVWLILTTLVRSIYAAVTLLLGIRGVNLRVILHPFDHKIDDVWQDPQHLTRFKEGYWSKYNNYFVTDDKGRKRPFGFWQLRPLNFVTLGLVLAGLYYLPPTPAFLLWMVCKGVVFAGIPIVLFVVLASYLWVLAVGKIRKVSETFPTMLGNLRARTEKRVEDLKAEIKNDEWIRYEPLLVDVTCGMVPMRVDVRSLSRPTVSLRFKAIKARVCRPYVRR
jgi:hypothetical protein